MFATPALVPISSFLIFSILFIPNIHINILVSVLSSKFCSAFLTAQVSRQYIRTCLMTVLYTAALSMMGILLSNTFPDMYRHFPIQLPLDVSLRRRMHRSYRSLNLGIWMS